jgi:hypothetical protein
MELNFDAEFGDGDDLTWDDIGECSSLSEPHRLALRCIK